MEQASGQAGKGIMADQKERTTELGQAGDSTEVGRGEQQAAKADLQGPEPAKEKEGEPSSMTTVRRKTRKKIATKLANRNL